MDVGKRLQSTTALMQLVFQCTFTDFLDFETEHCTGSLIFLTCLVTNLILTIITCDISVLIRG